MDLKNMKIKSILPQGVNRIDHAIRIKLKLNTQEYCIFDTIYERKQKRKETSFIDVETYTGFTPEDIEKCVQRMTEINLLRYKNDDFMLNKKLIDEAFKIREDPYEKEFEIFWKETVIVNGKEKEVNAWPGPRDATFKKFKEARKKYSLQFIMNQRKYYFELLETLTWRQKMQATKFLNVKTGQLSEDFKSQIPKYARKDVDTSQKLTKEERDKLFK